MFLASACAFKEKDSPHGLSEMGAESSKFGGGADKKKQQQQQQAQQGQQQRTEPSDSNAGGGSGSSTARSSTPTGGSSNGGAKSKGSSGGSGSGAAVASPSPGAASGGGGGGGSSAKKGKGVVDSTPTVLEIDDGDDDGGGPMTPSRTASDVPRMSVDDFELIKVVGNGCFGKVSLLRCYFNATWLAIFLPLLSHRKSSSFFFCVKEWKIRLSGEKNTKKKKRISSLLQEIKCKFTCDRLPPKKEENIKP